ncbi:MAG: MarC family protein, partial [Dehalococcoidia bacterium]|nr:MarC family protein [Dehalococcoidia bacterium]
MDLGFAVYSFVALFLIVDPIANVPIFLGFLGSFETEVRGRMVRTAVLMAALVLLFFTVAGTYVFRYLGIEIYSFQIAGGILLFIIAIEMLFG